MEPHKVIFTAAYGDTNKLVELSLQKSGCFDIYEDNVYLGQIKETKFSWTVEPQNPETFTCDDKEALLERAGLYVTILK